jgi:hypothetical protein
MSIMRRAAFVLVLPLLVGACALTDPTLTPSPSSTGTASPLPSDEAIPEPSVEPTASPTPGPELVPVFLAGSQVTTNAPGLRVRSRPGTEQRVITSLGVDADLLVGMGPVVVDGLGWYLVRDADADEPAFGEGWVAAGFEPDPFLISTSFEVGPNPYLAGFAHDADGEYGPVLLPGANVSMRWIAAPFDTGGCSFAVDLRAGSGAAVPAIRATVGTFPAPGELFSQFFGSHPDLVGSDLFIAVRSNCSWAMTFVQPLPEPTPSPTPAS